MSRKKPPSSFPARSVVFTNLDHVVVRGLRLTCQTIVINDDPDLNEGKERRFRLDGYGTTCVWHVFSMTLRSNKHKWAPIATPKGGPSLRGVLHVDANDAEGFTSLQLVTRDWDRGVRVQSFTGSWTPRPDNAADADAPTDWHDYNQRVMRCVFEQSCAETSAPNMLIALAMPPDTARRLLDADGSSFRSLPNH
jgi:hypothetical protein